MKNLKSIYFNYIIISIKKENKYLYYKKDKSIYIKIKIKILIKF